MTDYKCFTKCVKNCDKMCKIYPEHPNKNCHLKKYCCCYEIEANKLVDNEKKESQKVCKFCCCVVDKCKCQRKSPRRKNCTCRMKSKSPERELCKLCFCLLKNCVCREKKPKGSHENCRPRTLCEDLPLYDEKSHLLGYIKKGSIIDEPFCGKSRDRILESKSTSDSEEWPRMSPLESQCMASCRYAEGVRRESGQPTESVPRWTTKSAFDHTTRTPSPTPQRKSKRKPCTCGK